MTSGRRHEIPLEPVYPFNDAGASIVLHDGPVGGAWAGSRTGVVEFSFGCRPGLRWYIKPDEGDFYPDLDGERLRLGRRGRDWAVDAYHRDFVSGWINNADFADPDARMRRVLVHWMNLPAIWGPISLAAQTAGGEKRWTGRWRADIDEWSVTLDQRPDHTAVLKEAHATHVYVLTHVMEMRRKDGDTFNLQAAQQLLESLRVGFSFALGRWVAPVLPVGYDSSDRIVWESWTSPICDPAERVGSAWLYFPGRLDDLTELLTRTVAAFNDERRPGLTRFRMQLAIQSVGVGFVEQRIVAAFPALENLSWATFVLSGQMTARNYKREKAEDKLRRLLTAANIPTDVDAGALPAIADFAQNEGMDGPGAVTEVRNRLIHPKLPNDQIYHLDGLVRDAWLLARHYLTLLILHSIGYHGSYVKLIPPAGWASAAVPVPWTVNTASP